MPQLVSVNCIHTNYTPNVYKVKFLHAYADSHHFTKYHKSGNFRSKNIFVISPSYENLMHNVNVYGKGSRVTTYKNYLTRKFIT